MAKEYRPILDIPTSRVERVYDGISLGLVIGMCVIALWSMLHLPEVIPIHWNLKGEADGYGSRYWIVFIPILSIVYAFANSKLVWIPHKFNYLKRITEDNAKEEYLKGRKLIRLVHMISQLVFATIVFFTIKGAVTDNADFGVGLVIVLVIAIFAPVIYVIYNGRDQSSLT